jgi:sugar diacid utilization regulator
MEGSAPIDPGDALRVLLRERAADTEAALGIIRRITSSLDVSVVLGETMSIATAVAHCPIGVIYLLDEVEQRLWIRASSPGYEDLIDNYSLDVGAGLTGWTALNRAPAVVNDDPHDDPRYISVPEVDLDFRAALTVPMISPSNRLVGVILVHKLAPDVFSDDDLTALAPIAALAAAAVETAQLYTRSRRQIEVLRSVGELGDPLRSPAATRGALETLCESARLLLDGESVALYRRTATSWRLASSLHDGANAPQDEVPRELLDPLAISDEPVRLARSHHRELLEAVSPGGAAARAGIAARLEAGGEVVGAFVCTGGRATLSPTERELFGIIASVSAMIIQSEAIITRLSPRNAELAFLEALSEGTEPPGIVAARANQLGTDLAQPHVAATFQVIGSGGAEPERVLDRLRDELASGLPGSVAERHGLELLALLPASGSEAPVRETGEVLGAVEEALDVRVLGGLSGTVTDVGDYARAFAEARDARQIGKAMRGAERVIAYDRLGAQRHLWALARSSARDPFQERLEVLRQHDAEHGSELLDTVEGYLEEYGHRERASARLRVHRNTLRKRIERIKALSGIDLEDSATLFDVQTALSILRFRELQQDGVVNSPM